MPVKFSRKIAKIGDSFRIVIPAPIVKALNIEDGERLQIWLNDSKIIMER